MTICIAMHFDDYVLLAADTRRSFDPKSVIYLDDAKKIVETEIGIAVGCGMVDLLEAVEARISRKGTIRHHEDLLPILMEEREKYVASYRGTIYESWAARGVNETHLLITWEVTVEGEPQLRLGFLSHLIAGIGNPGKCEVLLTGNAPLEVREHYKSRLSEQMLDLDEFDSGPEHLDYHLGICADVIAHAAEHYPGVGPKMTFGVHEKGIRTFVSEIMDIVGEPAGVVDWPDPASSSPMEQAPSEHQPPVRPSEPSA